MPTRLSLSSSDPFPTSDITSANTVYCHFIDSDIIQLPDANNRWRYYTGVSTISGSVPASTNTNYAVYLYDNSGTLALDFTAWTNDTTRANALATLNGRYVKTGSTRRVWLGDIRTTGTSGQCEDSTTKLFCWNYYNQAWRSVSKSEHSSTASWTDTNTSYHSWNDDANNVVEAILGLPTPVDLLFKAVSDGTAAGSARIHGIGSSTSAVYSACRIGISYSTDIQEADAILKTTIEPGYRPFHLLERSAGSGTTTWYGTLIDHFGLTGKILG